MIATIGAAPNVRGTPVWGTEWFEQQMTPEAFRAWLEEQHESFVAAANNSFACPLQRYIQALYGDGDGDGSDLAPWVGSYDATIGDTTYNLPGWAQHFIRHVDSGLSADFLDKYDALGLLDISLSHLSEEEEEEEEE